MNRMKHLVLVATLFVASVCLLYSQDANGQPNAARLVIAHHMNAEPPVKAGGQDTFGNNTPTLPRVRPGSIWAEIGGRVRDRAIGNLYDVGLRPMPEQAAWEIAVAKRAGVDAFAFYDACPQARGGCWNTCARPREPASKLPFAPAAAREGIVPSSGFRPCVSCLRRIMT